MGHGMRVRDLLDMTDLRLSPLTGRVGLDRQVRWVFTTDLPDPSRYLSGGELLLTGLMWRRGPQDAATFAAAAAAGHVACVAAGDAVYGSVPADVVAACRQHDLPLLEVPAEVSFANVTEQVVRRLLAERDAGVASQLGRRRRLLTAVAAGAGLETLLRLAATDAATPCWLFTASGRAPARAPAPLSASRSRRLAKAYRSAPRLPQVARVSHGGAATTYSLFPVGAQDEARLTAWFLAFEGDHRQWGYARHDTASELVSLVTLERERALEAQRGRRATAERLARLAASTRPDPAELATLCAEAGLAAGRQVVVAASVSDPDGGAEVACAVLEDALASQASPAVTAVLDQEAIAVVPVPEAATWAARFTESLREHMGSLATGLGEHRLSLGVSLPADGPSGLHTALHEARQARMLAELQPGRVVTLGTGEIDSHALLLAAVPREVRQTFRARVLGPLIDYDARHHTDLLRTLRVFLEASCSWTQCAQALHVHVNTLRYRIERIEALTGRSVSALDSRIDFYVALRSD